jgi:hypothetical protein
MCIRIVAELTELKQVSQLCCKGFSQLFLFIMPAAVHPMPFSKKPIPVEQPILFRYLEFDHAAGEYTVVEEMIGVDNRRHHYIRKCCAYLVDCFCVILSLAFLAFAFWLYTYAEYRYQKSNGTGRS